MNNSPQHGPRGASRGHRRHGNAQARGPGHGRKHRRNTQGRRQGPPAEARGHRRNRPQGRFGNQEHQPKGRGNRQFHQPDNNRPHHPMGRPFEIQNRMQHVFDRRSPFRMRRRQRGKFGWRPEAGFSGYDDRFEIVAELPGVGQDNVSVSISDNLLTIKGKKQRKQKDETRNIHKSELRYGRFRRVFPIPPKAQIDGIKADFKDGVLTIVIPKKEEAKPTEIPINVDA